MDITAKMYFNNNKKKKQALSKGSVKAKFENLLCCIADRFCAGIPASPLLLGC